MPAQALSPVQEIKTESGLTAWLVEDHALPLVTFRVAFREAGTASDSLGKEGRARLASNLLDEGAGEMDALAFATARDDRAIRWDVNLDADMLVISLQSLSEHRDEALRLLALALTKPRFDAEAVARIRAQMLAGLARAEQDPETIAGNAWHRAAFGAHAYGRPPGGTKAGLLAVTRGDLQAFARERITRGGLLIGIVGDVTPAQAKKLLETHLSALPKGEKIAGPAQAALPEKTSAERIARDIPQTVVRFGGPGLLRTDPDYLTGYVVNEVVGGGGLTSRLSEEIREKRGLAYSVSSDLAPMLHAGVMAGGFATRGDQAEAATRVLNETLAKIHAEGITEMELQEAKQFLTGEFPMRLDSQGELAAYLITMQLYGLGRDYLEKRNALIRAVTLEDANRVAKKLYDPTHLTLVAVGKTEATK